MHKIKYFLVVFLSVYAMSAHAIHGYSDDFAEGQYIGSFTVGLNVFGDDFVLISPPTGETYNDPSSCNDGSTVLGVVLLNTADDLYKSILTQIIAAAAVGQKVIFVLEENGCVNIGWGVMRPVVVGIVVRP